jgi:hypothetical protein
MALTLDGTNGIVSSGSITTQSATGVIFSDSSSLPAASSPYVLKNRIINGDMVIDQRNAGASVTCNSGANTFPLDRTSVQGTASAGVFTAQRSTVAPQGFINSLLCTVTTSSSPSAAHEYSIRQSIEGFNVADLGWGTANAKTVTISFWVRSSVTGTFAGSLTNSAFNRSYAFTYVINAANTWEQKSVTIAGDTTGTWLTDNGSGVRLTFNLGAGSNGTGTAGVWTGSYLQSATGSVNLITTSGATFYITGVQLEQNTSATPFERRLYNQELANCQRYYQTLKASNIIGSTATTVSGTLSVLVPLRTDSITVGKTSGAMAIGDMVSFGTSSTTTPTDAGYLNNSISFGFNMGGFTGLTAYRSYRSEPNVTNPAIFTLSAEL